MLQTTPTPLRMAEFAPHPGADGLDLEKILAVARRRAWLVAVCSIIGALLGLLYLVVAVPLYTSSTQLLIDTRDSQSAQEAAVMPDVVFDDATVDSQVGILRSQRIADAVIDRLSLLTGEQFAEDGSTLFATAADAVDRAFDLLRGDAREAQPEPVTPDRKGVV